MKKIISIVGARPQFIKAASVSRNFQSLQGIEEKIIHTGQHYDDNMSRIFFRELKIPEPAYNLGVGSSHHGAQTGRMLAGIEEILMRERPDHVVVFGDTNSTLAGALAAVKLHIPISHVEAGLRSYNRQMPEEINRILTDHAADLLFTPTETASANLLREGLAREKIFLVGDVMYDAAIFYEKIAARQSNIIGKLNLQEKGYILSTVHRAENTDSRENLTGIFESLMDLAREHTVVMPLHPRTVQAMTREKIWDAASSSINIIEPVGYLDMIMLEKNARLIATDSGGIQKEAYFHRVPCITFRDETEWLELVEKGFNVIVGTKPANIMASVNMLLQKELDWRMPLYGNGAACGLIADNIRRFL